MEDRLHEQEQMARAGYEESIQLAKNLDVFLRDPKFQELFGTHFIDNYAITQIKNYSLIAPDRRFKVHENMIGRSVFTSFMTDIMTAGNASVIALRELDAPAPEDDVEDTEEYN